MIAGSAYFLNFLLEPTRLTTCKARKLATGKKLSHQTALFDVTIVLFCYYLYSDPQQMFHNIVPYRSGGGGEDFALPSCKAHGSVRKEESLRMVKQRSVVWTQNRLRLPFLQTSILAQRTACRSLSSSYRTLKTYPSRCHRLRDSLDIATKSELRFWSSRTLKFLCMVKYPYDTLELVLLKTTQKGASIDIKPYATSDCGLQQDPANKNAIDWSVFQSKNRHPTLEKTRTARGFVQIRAPSELVTAHSSA